MWNINLNRSVLELWTNCFEYIHIDLKMVYRIYNIISCVLVFSEHILKLPYTVASSVSEILALKMLFHFCDYEKCHWFLNFWIWDIDILSVGNFSQWHYRVYIF